MAFNRIFSSFSPHLSLSLFYARLATRSILSALQKRNGDLFIDEYNVIAFVL